MGGKTVFRSMLALSLAIAGLAALLGLLDGAQDQVYAASPHSPFSILHSYEASSRPVDGLGVPRTSLHPEPSFDPDRALAASSSAAPRLYSGATTVITVCSAGCDHSFIQAAVDAATTGDVIKVAQGTYTDADADGYVIEIAKSLTVRGGYTVSNWTTPDPDGYPTILDGGGNDQVLRISAGDPTIEGFHIWRGSATQGAGVYIAGGDPVVRRNRIYENNATGDGGGVYIASGSSLLENNLIYTNTANARGGGIYVVGNDSPSIRYNTLYDNRAVQEGGGVYIASGSPIINSSIIVGNAATTDGGGGIYRGGGNATPAYNDVWSNTGGNYGGFEGIIPASDIQVDPRFVDSATADFHLQADSPCIGAADSDYYPEDDYDGYSRPFGSRSDIGGHEFYTGTCFARLSTGTRVYTTVQAAVLTATAGAEVWVAGHCTGSGSSVVTLTKELALRGGYTLTNWSDPDRDIYPTILDGEGVRRVIYIADTVPAFVEGLHVRNGSTSGGGGGIYVAGSDQVSTIRGNWIYSNSADLNGGGVYLQGGSPTVENNGIYSNTSLGNGGGVYLSDWSQYPTIDGNSIHHNQGTGHGGGIDVWGNATSGYTVTIWHNEMYSNTSNGYGGGISIRKGFVVVRDNGVYSNTALRGGGIYVSANGTVKDNTVSGNRAVSSGDNDGGGGVYLQGNVSLRGNIIHGNVITGTGLVRGGGIHVWVSGETVTVEDNRIDGNDSKRTGGGIYVRIDAAANVAIRNNLIYTNTTGSEGGGIGISTVGSSATVENNTIYDNWASSNGGGVWAYGSHVIRNNIIVGNADVGIYGASGTPVATYNDVWGNPVGQCGGSASCDATNIDADPQFVNPGVNFRLQSSSPCIDAITSTVYPTYDYDGYARPYGVYADVGAHEFYTGTCFARLSTGGRVYTTVQAAVFTATAGVDDVSVAGLCQGAAAMVTLDKSLVLGGGYTITNWISPTTPTILDAQGQGRVVHITSADPVTVGEFIIMGGDAAGDGGGIYVATLLSPTIRNVVFYNNTATNGGGFASSGGNPRLYNNTFVNNTATTSGGGLYLDDGFPVVRNTIVVSNTGGGIFATTSATPVLAYNDVWQNTGGNYVGVVAGTTDFSVAPLFEDFAGADFHLDAGSPCIHSGDPGTTLTWDFEGDDRPLGRGYDVGADEAKAYPDVDFGPSFSYLFGFPGEDIVHIQYLTNTGSITDTFDLTHTVGPVTWTVDYQPIFALQAGEAVEMPVVISIPAEAISGTSVVVVITATSRANPNVYGVVSASLIVNRNPGVLLTPAYTDHINPGIVMTYEHTLFNTGNAGDTFDVKVRESSQWAIASVVPTRVVNLGPQTAATVLVIIEEINPGSTPGGLVETTVVSASSLDSGAWATVIDTTKVNHVPGDRYVAATALATDTLNSCQSKVYPCRTIAHAVEQAATGDAVSVTQGVYYEHDLMLNKDVTLAGGYAIGYGIWDPDGYPTILDAQGLGRVFYVFGNPTVEGFILRGGSTAGSGGGVYVEAGSPTLRHNVIVSNTASVYGGGVYNWRGNPTLERNVLSLNAANYGGGLASSSGNLDFWNNMVYENVASMDGGGVYVTGGYSRIWHGTFYSNTASRGGGLYLAGSSVVSASNTIVVSNSASSTGGGIYRDGSAVTVDYNDVWGNVSGGDYVGLSAGSNSISTDPLFVDAAGGDLHLVEQSPCVDTGSATSLEEDFDGDSRPMAAAPDIGADEFRRFGLEFTADSEMVGYRDKPVFHYHTLTNTGSYTETFQFVCLSSWTSCPGDIVVEPGKTVAVTVTVNVPGDAISGDVEIDLVTASIKDLSASANLAVQRYVVDTTIVGLSYGVDVLPDDKRVGYIDYPSQIGQTPYWHWVRNTGSWHDTFDIECVGSQPWPVTCTPNQVYLPVSHADPEPSTWVEINVYPPTDWNHCDLAPPEVDIITVTATSLSDPSGQTTDSGGSATIVVDPCPGVSLEPSTDSKSGYPGSTVLYEHTLTNNGHFWDDFDLVASGVGVAVPGTVGPMEAGESWTADIVVVTIPSEPPVPCGTELTAIVTATSRTSTWAWVMDVEWDSVEDTTSVLPFPRAMLGPDRTARVASHPSQGTPVTYTHRITNSGNCTFTFGLTATSDLGFNALVSPTSVMLAGGEWETVTVVVTVPPITPTCANLRVDTTEIEAQAQGYPRPIGYITMTDTTSVNLCEVMLYPDDTALAPPGTVITYLHTLSNTGVITDSYVLAYRDYLAWQVEVTPTTVADLPPGHGITVTAKVSVPPTTTEVLAGTVNTTVITATSPASGVSDTVTDTTLVPYAPSAVVGLGHSGQIGPAGSGRADPGGTITYTHSLTNTGNWTDTFELTTHSTFGHSTVIDPIVPVELGPKEVYTQIVVTVQIPEYAGGGETEQTEVIATFAYDEGAQTVEQAVAENATTVNFITGTRYVAPSGQDGNNNCAVLDYGPCATPYQAVYQAASGDQVRVAQGIYTDVHVTGGYTHVLYLEKDLALRGGYTITTNWNDPNPVAYPTVLDAGGQGRVIYVAGGIVPTIEGFHLRGGYVSGEETQGAGIYIAAGAVPTVRSNYIYDNMASGDGSRGGGLYYGGGGDPLLERNTVYNNTAEAGAGLYIAGGSPQIWNSVIYDNSSVNGEGGGLYLVSGSPTLWNNTVYRNTASGTGGGIYVAGGSPVISNTIVADNTNDGVVRAGGAVLVDYNDVWGNSPANYVGVTTGTNSISLDPSFVSTAEPDLRLSGSSPCVDAGDPNTALNEDRDGNIRPLPSLGGYDIGAYEYGLASVKAVTSTETITKGVSPGEVVTYTIVMTNSGDVAQPVYITDTLHPYLDCSDGLLLYVPSDGEYQKSPCSVSWQGSVAGGDTATIIFTARIADRVAPGTFITNVAWINSSATPMVTTTVGRRPGPRYVATTGDDSGNSCLDTDDPCRTVQYAVNMALDGDSIHVAMGVYTDTGPLVSMTNKSLTLIGGYTRTVPEGEWTYDPDVYTTTLDAQGGQGVIITGPATGTVTLAGFHVENGADGVVINTTTAAISRTRVYSNSGDGIRVTNCALTLERSWVYDNGGDGVDVSDSSYQLDNNVIAGNVGAGLWATGTSIGRLRHNTFARNASAGVDINGVGSQAYFTNTIFYSHTVGVSVTAGSADLAYTLWATNTSESLGSVSSSYEYSGAPKFRDPDGMDYRIQSGSDALDRGVDAGVSEDMGGDPRPMGHGYDLGADELRVSLSVTKQADPDPVEAGAQLIYTIRVTNTGEVDLTATITDTPSAHVTPTGGLTWNPAPIAPGEIWTQTVVVTVATDYPGPLTNVVQVTTDEGATGAYTETSDVMAVEVSKRADPDPVQAGAQLTYTIYVTNTGSVTLTVTVTDELPVRTSPTGLLAWSPVVIVPGDTWTDTVVVTVELGYEGWLTNVVGVTTDEGVTDVYTETTEVQIKPALRVTKQATPDPVQAGERLTYTIRVENTGNVTLTATTITDVLPARVSPTGSLTWTLDSPLAPGDSWVTTTLPVTVAWGYSGPLTNVVQAATAEGAAGVYTDVSQAQVTPMMEVIKQASPNPAEPGGQLTYTIRITNTGNVTLTAIITDVLPEYVSHITATDVLTWSAVITGPGGAWTKQFTVAVAWNYEGYLENIVKVTTEEGAEVIHTTYSWVGITPALDVTKQASSHLVEPGARLTYTIRVTNTGTVDLHATITDTLPEHVTTTQALVWSSQLITVPGDVWVETVVVTVEIGYVGPLTNVVRVTTAEGAAGVYTETSRAAYEPDVTVSPGSLSAILNPGYAADRTLTIGNVGTRELTWTLETLPAAGWLTEVPTNGVLAPLESTGVDITFDASGLAPDVYTTTLRVASNDPDEPRVDVNVVLTVTLSCIPVDGASFSFTPPNPLVGETVTFIGSVAQGTPSDLSYVWDFGDNQSDSGQVVAHTYDISGTYSVVMTATNCFGTGEAVYGESITVGFQPPGWPIYLPLVLRNY